MHGIEKQQACRRGAQYWLAASFTCVCGAQGYGASWLRNEPVEHWSPEEQ